ncbi:hypothetical protein E2P64_07560 [Candidatus Bathyarchaeota archaeon]|nr:hypothetical protein E2P64_07560 [Candidatus Bathyarchaeota archaeon]
MKLPFNYTLIERGELPALERKGCLAQEMIGKDLILVVFHQTHTECISLNDLPIPKLEKKFKKVPRPGIDDTIVVGSLRKLSEINLVDVLTIEGRSARGKHWSERLEMLRLLCDSFSEEGKKQFPLARQWDRGLLKVFDEVVESSGSGLLIRVPGKPQALLCTPKKKQKDVQ